jgi:hypothetical protein
MRTRFAAITSGILFVVALPVLAQTPSHPGRAPLPAKPPTVTAVAPQQIGPHPGYAALNPQPIPPGHAATSTVRPLTTTGYGALNTQPIPPGHSAGAPRIQ